MQYSIFEIKHFNQIVLFSIITQKFFFSYNKNSESATQNSVLVRHIGTYVLFIPIVFDVLLLRITFDNI